MSLTKLVDEVLGGGGTPIDVPPETETTVESCTELDLSESTSVYIEAEVTYPAGATDAAAIRVYTGSVSGVCCTTPVQEFAIPLLPESQRRFGISAWITTSKYMKVTLYNPNPAHTITGCKITVTRQVLA